jgi:hypothetical protein
LDKEKQEEEQEDDELELLKEMGLPCAFGKVNGPFIR